MTPNLECYSASDMVPPHVGHEGLLTLDDRWLQGQPDHQADREWDGWRYVDGVPTKDWHYVKRAVNRLRALRG